MAQREEEYKRLELFYQMLVYYLDRPYSDVELGEELGTHDSNVWRIRTLMQKGLHIPIQQSPGERGKYFIRKDFQMRYIHFSPEEMASLYLGARRLQQQTKTSQEHVELALKKLANAMRKPFAESLLKAAKTIEEQEQDAQQQQVFSTLVKSWLEKVPIRIYHTTPYGSRRDYIVHPYHIEPSVWGDGNYLIGYSEYHEKIARFKIARIDKVVLSGGPYREETDFDVQQFLKYAWGIWSTYGEPVTVRLRFNKWAIPLLKESVYPHAVLHNPDKDGNCEWEVQVGEWREMEAWVKGWGSKVTVLEPIEMVEKIKRDVRRLVQNYQINELPPIPSYQLLWAKTGSDDSTHPLICHMVDVGQVALCLWNQVLAHGMRQQIANTLQLSIEQAGRLIAFWASLHDLGKACPAFQAKHPPVVSTLKNAGFQFSISVFKDSVYHATITTCTLDQLLVEVSGINRQLAIKIGQALGGHHGFWPTSTELKAQRTKPDVIGSGLWHEARKQLVHVLHNLFSPLANPGLDVDTIEQSNLNALLTLFSGITSLADWIGSMDTYFTFEDAPLDPQLYSTISATHAQKALQKLGLTSWQFNQVEIDFAAMFNVPAPRPMQQTVIELAAQLTQPSLVIIEAPTGSGKTEAALYLVDIWSQKFQQRGLYVAMPTMATSNQMHERTTEFLQRRYPEQQIEPLLVHSQARWLEHDPPPDLKLMDERPKTNASIVDMSWFLPRKRSLLAPFAVGTVDQALLSVLQTRHFFIRLLGLSHKTIIFDEVHAYDAYMSQLFQQLLHWLRSLGASVVLLSATLPKQAREDFLRAYTNSKSIQLPNAEYPAISWASGDKSDVILLSKNDSRTLKLGRIDRSIESVVHAAGDAIENGGCIAIICNTVARAQAIYKELVNQIDLVPDPDENLILFHARSPFAWRDATEKKVLKLFGKSKKGEKDWRPHKAIVVATQVIEQSLDLDFDLMISDLAPIDLLLQRAGRLHRHEGRVRPQTLQTAQLLLTFTPTAENLPEFEDDDAIYEPYVLLRSYLVLAGRHELVLPTQTPSLIEAVYSNQSVEEIMSIPELPTVMMDELAKAKEKMDEHLKKARREADKRLIALPNYEDLLTYRNEDLEEDNPAVHQAYQAMTRLGPRTIAVVCLHRTINGLNTEPDGSGTTIELNQEPDTFTTKQLARYTVIIHHRGIVNFFVDPANSQYMPPAWKEHSLLRDHYLVEFKDNHFQLVGTPYHLYLTRACGLEIRKDKA